MKIRPAIAEDARALSSLALRSKAHWGYTEDELEIFADELTLDPSELESRSAHVIEDAGTPLGFYTLLEQPTGDLELEHLFVEPGSLRRGVGSRLLRHALRAAGERGFTTISVVSDPNATGFYRAHGAALVEQIPSSIPGRSIPRLMLPVLSAAAVVRPEEAGDQEAVFRLVERAFGSRGEAELVTALRSLRPSVSLVAEWQGEIVGHAFFSPVTVRGAAGESWPALALGPLAVVPERQRLGIGGLLTRAGIEACRGLGATRLFVLGHPEYYPQFGFEPAAPRGLHYRSEAFDDAFFALELVEGALRGLAGNVEYASAFDAV
ncbi:MAG: GNAT family N-acetyltransferase [Myxococcota bacterium]